MKIRRTTLEDLDEILIIYADARAFMKKQNNPSQWGEDYPRRELLESDISLDRSYVCVLDNRIVGTFYFEVGVDSTYMEIFEGEWLDDAPYAVIHRIASARDSKGVASFCVDWCFNQHPNIRIDTHRNNNPMIRFLEKNGFMKCGIIYIENGDERIAFHRIK
ncbi:GNAT family N-acetyltransferase [Petrocella sp. FN5]|uniref:GNAT family N-acetyltransferase n=1 Tax=Petrocella sp. FN5 TaxID=3032002 RepID=UPI0023D9A175|nr:GNAT family N-acetyltransferase [Petrocella sp. FN5]MDF1617925.1 GNAT family N-acetyltransferase [Petrocella sp. FN5]